MGTRLSYVLSDTVRWRIQANANVKSAGAFLRFCLAMGIKDSVFFFCSRRTLYGTRSPLLIK